LGTETGVWAIEGCDSVRSCRRCDWAVTFALLSGTGSTRLGSRSGLAVVSLRASVVLGRISLGSLCSALTGVSDSSICVLGTATARSIWRRKVGVAVDWESGVFSASRRATLAVGRGEIVDGSCSAERRCRRPSVT
jgi:hypothetical protein